MKWWLPVLIFSSLAIIALEAQSTVLDEVFGAALLNSISPKLRKKLENIHNEGKDKPNPIRYMEKLMKKTLKASELKELKYHYKRLSLPVVQSTLDRKFGKKHDYTDHFPVDFISSGGTTEDDNDNNENISKLLDDIPHQNDKSIKPPSGGKKRSKKPESDRPMTENQPKITKQDSENKEDKTKSSSKEKSTESKSSASKPPVKEEL